MGTLHGTGYTRRDDMFRRVMKAVTQGSVIPLKGFFGDQLPQLLFGPVNVVITTAPTGQPIFTCGFSKCGGSDVCGE